MKKETLPKKEIKSLFNLAKVVLAIGIIGILILLLSSCQKETTLLPVFTYPDETTSKKIKTTTITSEAYNSSYYDSCRNENIILTGSVTYTIKLISDTSANYSFSYDIDLKATGIGEITGTTFKGGITQRATVTQKTENGGSTKATINYKLKFVGENGEHITFTQIVKFIYIDGETKLLFNDISDSCK